MSKVTVTKVNNVFLSVECDRGVAQELGEYFCFYAYNYQFHPMYKNKVWDGKIRLLDRRTNQMYLGLFKYIEKFCTERGYSLDMDPRLSETTEYSLHEAQVFSRDLAAKLDFDPHDFQEEGLAHVVRNNGRSILLSPTASGKSFLIYLLIKYYNSKTLIIADTIGLVGQMRDDLIEYGYPADQIHTVTGVDKKSSDKQLVIATWKGLYRQDKKYFAQYEVTIGDEVHLFNAKSLIKIMTSLTNSGVRVGLTGTLDDVQVHQISLEGLFGPVRRLAETKDLIERGILSDVNIKGLVLKYHADDRAILRKLTMKLTTTKKFQAERLYLTNHKRRQRFIVNLALSMKENSLVLFQIVEQGKELYEMVKAEAGDRKVFLVYQKTSMEARQEIRRITEKEKDAIIIASFKTFATGTNIRNLYHVILANSGKGKIRLLQSIGRSLRIGQDTASLGATIYDIADDLSMGSYVNYAMQHFVARIKIYAKEGFKFKTYNIKL